MNLQQQATKIQELMAGGASLDEALKSVLAELVPVNKDNRVEYLRGLNSLSELSLWEHRAHAKKSKMKLNPVAVARYNAEIEACRARSNELRMKLTEEGETLKGLIELGAKPSTVIQAWLTEKEKALETPIETYKASNKLTNKGLKLEALKASSTVHPEYEAELKELGDDYLKKVVERLEAGDQRVVALIKKRNLIQ